MKKRKAKPAAATAAVMSVRPGLPAVPVDWSPVDEARIPAIVAAVDKLESAIRSKAGNLAIDRARSQLMGLMLGLQKGLSAENLCLDSVRREMAVFGVYRAVESGDETRILEAAGKFRDVLAPRGKPGRKAKYDLKARKFARELRQRQPALTVKELRERTQKRFPKAALPPARSFRNWIGPKKRTQ